MGGSRWGLLLSTTALTSAAFIAPAAAVCSAAVGTAGNDSISCIAGAPPTASIDLTQGGNDTLTVSGGTIGPVTFSGGNDQMQVMDGVIGAINQALGIDTFTMSGGTIDSLDQGGDRDIFVMSGGTIIGTFTDGDVVTMTGGFIGGNMALVQGNNIVDMSGGTIAGNMTAAANDDTLNLSGGTIGGFVDFGNGNNAITVTGGQIASTVTTGAGTDSFLWNGGGTIGGTISLGAGNDSATLRNLSDAVLASAPQMDGGTDADSLTFDNTRTTGFARYLNWENVALINGSRLTLDGNVVLGDAGTLTGALSIDATSALFAGNGAAAVIQSFGGPAVNVNNAGVIDLRSGTPAATDMLTIAGNYVGLGGRLGIDAVLGSDGSPSDRLVISGAGASASGSTGIIVSNLGGPGAPTSGSGILVVEATGGATTAPGSFALGAPAAAGAYEYLLFKGGAGGANPDNWYLRSTVQGASAVPDAIANAVLPPDVTPLIRPEVAIHAALPQIARTLAVAALGTFHDRRGQQQWLTGDLRSGVWGRVFGSRLDAGFERGVRPEFNGNVFGFQAGHDLWRGDFGTAIVRSGFLVSHTRASGDVSGFAIGLAHAPVGELNVNATNVGGYWTLLGQTGWYVDAVMQMGLIGGTPRSYRGVAANVDGHAFAASLEGGYPIVIGPSGLTFEPQAQIIWNETSLDRTRDWLSTIQYGNDGVFSARLGGRLQQSFGDLALPWQLYAKANVWWGSSGLDSVMFGTDIVETKRQSDAMIEVGGGVSARLTQFASVYGSVTYLSSLGDDASESIGANAGLRVTW